MQILRQVVFEMQGLTGNRVIKRQIERMQELASQTHVATLVARAMRRVKRVADKWMGGVFHMYANLMGATGEQLAIDKRIAVIARAGLETLNNRKSRDSLAGAIAIANCHAHPLGGMSRNRRIDHARVMRDDSVDKCQITPLDDMILNGRHQRLACDIGFRRHHEARRIHIEPVHDSQTVLFALHIAQVLCSAMVDEGVHERPVTVVFRGMAHETRLLGQHDDIIVFVPYVKRNGLSYKRCVDGFFVELEGFAGLALMVTPPQG